METNIIDLAMRIKSLREDMEISVEAMALVVGVPTDEYIYYEKGERDFGITFLNKCAARLGVDVTDLLTGEQPKLSTCTVVRFSEGLPIERRAGFTYSHLAYTFKNKIAEPMHVTAPFIENNETITLSVHEGQEMDFILSGSLRVVVDQHEFILNEGDTIYYDSAKPHGMVAVGGKDCSFLAIILKKLK